MRYKKFDIAVIQMDEAVRQFLDHKNNIAAVTLAGAAEEIFGSALKNAGKQTALGRLMDYWNSQDHLPRYEPAGFANLLNRTRNALKHDNHGGEAEVEVGPADAIMMLGRAIGMHGVLVDDPTEQARRWVRWFHQHAQDFEKDFFDPTAEE